MTLKEELIRKIEQASDALLEEVLNFLLFTKMRHHPTLSQMDKAIQLEHAQQYNRPIWEIADEIIAEIPEAEFSKLPTDGSAQIDHYLYGAPKQDSWSDGSQHILLAALLNS